MSEGWITKLQKEHSFGHSGSTIKLTLEWRKEAIKRRFFGKVMEAGLVKDKIMIVDAWEFIPMEMRATKFRARACLFVLCPFLICLFASTAFAAAEAERVKQAGDVMKEILNIPDDIPQDLLDKAECVVILPSVKKGAFGVGGSYGRGVMMCRSGQHYSGPWGAPALYALEGVSIGFQLGGQATDFVLLVMNPKGARSLLSSKVKLGADASAAAGPKGRTAEGATDIVMNAEILSYSRNKGLFAGNISGGLDAALRRQRQ